MNLATETRVGYDSNVFNRSEDDPAGEIDSAEIMLRLKGSVEETLDRGHYRAAYTPTYFINTASEAKNTWNHNAAVEGTYVFSPRTQLTLGDDFVSLEKIRFIADDPTGPLSPGEDPNFDAQRRRTLRNVTRMSFSHAFTPRWGAYMGSPYTIYRYSQNQDEESDGVSGYAGTNYQLHRQLQIGGGVQASYRSVQGEKTPLVTVGPPGMEMEVPLCFEGRSSRSRTQSYSAFGAIAYVFDETTRIQVQAGPARLESDFSQCNGATRLYTGFKRDSTTWFAQGEFLKRWERVDTSLRYVRSEGVASRGNASINDTLVGGVNWQFARPWKLGLRGAWIHRNGINGGGTTTWNASVRVSRQLAQRLTADATVSYRNQSQDSGSGFRDYETWQAFVGLQYAFDSFRY